METPELCDEILKRTYAMLHSVPKDCPETEKEMLKKIYQYAQEIKMKYMQDISNNPPILI